MRYSQEFKDNIVARLLRKGLSIAEMKIPRFTCCFQLRYNQISTFDLHQYQELQTPSPLIDYWKPISLLWRNSFRKRYILDF